MIELGYITKSYKLIPTEKEELIYIVKSILNWCEQNINCDVTRRSKVKIILENKDNNSNILGEYVYEKKTIIVYLCNIKYIISLIEIIIHEYTHHLQIRNSKDLSQYSLLTTNKSYWNNEFEIVARKNASKYKLKCIKDLF